MDLSLCSIELTSSGATVQWSGANNPLWYLQNNELKEIPADKQPIGKYEGEKPFSSHVLNLSKGDSLYLFTDGYADQFGGDKGKKFKYRQLNEKLLQVAGKSMNQQKETLDSDFEKWRSNLEQTDDVCIVGIRI